MEKAGRCLSALSRGVTLRIPAALSNLPQSEWNGPNTISSTNIHKTWRMYTLSAGMSMGKQRLDGQLNVIQLASCTHVCMHPSEVPTDLT